MEILNRYYTINRGPHSVEDNINLKKENLFRHFDAEYQLLSDSLGDEESYSAHHLIADNYSGSSAIAENSSDAAKPGDIPPFLKRSVYAPEEIFIEFANIDLSINSLLKFADKYGLLVLGRELEIEYNKLYEPLQFWYENICSIKSLLNITKLYQQKNISSLKNYFESIRGQWYYIDKSFDKFLKEPIKIHISSQLRESFEDNYESLFLAVVEMTINPNLERTTSIEVSINDENKIKKMTRYRNLISYIYATVLNFYNNDKEISNCLKCGNFFTKSKKIIKGELSESKKIYCSDYCRTSRNKEAEIEVRIKKQFEKKGYQFALNNRSHFKFEEKIMFPDIWLYDKNNLSLLAILELSASEIRPQSKKWKFKCNQIVEALKLINSWSGCNYAYLANSLGEIYYWDLKKIDKINGKFIGSPIESKNLTKSKNVKFTNDGRMIADFKK